MAEEKQNEEKPNANKDIISVNTIQEYVDKVKSGYEGRFLAPLKVGKSLCFLALGPDPRNEWVRITADEKKDLESKGLGFLSDLVVNKCGARECSNDNCDRCMNGYDIALAAGSYHGKEFFIKTCGVNNEDITQHKTVIQGTKSHLSVSCSKCKSPFKVNEDYVVKVHGAYLWCCCYCK
eukprot:219160_1